MSNVGDFIEDLQPELRVGGGATLDELFNLAMAIQADLDAIKNILAERNH